MLRNLRKYSTEEEMECIIPIERDLLDISWKFADSNTKSDTIVVQPHVEVAGNARNDVIVESELARSDTSIPLFRSHIGNFKFQTANNSRKTL